MSDLNTSKHASTQTEILDVIAARWSPRAFSNKPVSSEAITKLFTAASWAASSANEQPWRFLFGRNGDASFAKILDTLVEANQTWAKQAPVLILSIVKGSFSPGPFDGKPNRHALHDTGAASAYLALEATAQGLHAHGMAGFDSAKARNNFEIPAEFEIGACFAIGYLGDPETLPEPLKSREISPRSRKPISDFVFSEWEVSATL